MNSKIEQAIKNLSGVLFSRTMLRAAPLWKKKVRALSDRPKHARFCLTGSSHD
jgi:hypothetical protein